MKIEFPDEMRNDLVREAAEAGIPSVDMYVRVMYERAKYYFGVNGESWWGDASDGDPSGPAWSDPATRERLLQLIEEGMNSGPPIPVTPAFWEGLRRRVEERVAAKGTPQ